MKHKGFFKWAGILFLAGAAAIFVIYLIFDYSQEDLSMNQEARQQAPGKFIGLSKGITHYQLEGPETGKTIVLIHGGMVSGMYVWRKNIPALKDKGFRVLTYDLYGRGYSDRVQEEYTPQLLFTQLEELLDSLQIKEPISIAGLSIGSMVAIEYSRKHPHQLEELILLAPVARGKAKVQPALTIPLLSDLLMTFYWYPRTVNNQMNELFKPEEHPEYEEKLRKMIRFKGYKSSNYSTWFNTLMYNMEPQIEELGNQKIPIALIFGSHDPYVTKEEVEFYQILLPQLELFEVKEAGHVVNYEKPDKVNSIMAQFLSR